MMTKIENEFSIKSARDKDGFGADSIPDILAEKTKLPSPPLICIKILELVRKDDFTFQELAQIIGADPSLTAKLLTVANTPHYTRSGQVSSVEKVIFLLKTEPSQA
ncbi:MAG: HDOD domain-containing protein [Oryzomonas sp.]|uniref:HDOD domain-containing protein n=1 Tax=Oryzomonas sp. TaxID=2855186 RepID=UPI002840306E|nr:HDOD domain-containing protein [Oryzomonas sp.]MDR3581593.1 HDOD domain-containing protein [Oryzomonas sp.]